MDLNRANKQKENVTANKNTPSFLIQIISIMQYKIPTVNKLRP